MFKDYHNKGFVILEDAGLPESDITLALQSVHRVMAGQYNTGIRPWAEIDVNNPEKVQRISQIHMADTNLYRLLTDRRIGRLLADVTGARQIRLGASQLYFKAPNSGEGGVVGFHRDSHHFPYFADGMFSAWIPLSDVNHDSGALTFIEGSHQWQKRVDSSGAQIQQYQQQRLSLKHEYTLEDWREHDAIVPAGGIGIHHKDVIHGSAKNSSDQPRCLLGFTLLTDQLQLDPNAQDYGYADIMGDDSYCPIIYPQD